ncbi:2OG-Fe(II) oxygenase [Phormidium sp. LEGE 05292]|uniref:2OG-Fe(II) oxygenase n=1 Tax=[Phormidium] sp. LEGE 05292 TaxID=767427 RepID=UPI00187F4EB0|nr:2OG-Fe(II) oxygenase [Phormidium sp. LEGE 05292]MBE9226116.1 2OG-Fe(II) oxygenase [Phormidium sp. LEGE 05292]
MEFHLEAIATEKVKVNILLNGGHNYTIWLNTNSPLLHSLLAVTRGESQQQPNSSSQWFHIPLENGQSALSFPQSSLVGVVTEPSLLLQSYASNNPQERNILTSPCFQMDNFLSEEEKTKLISYSLEKESAFVDTAPLTNTSYHPDHRRSWVLHQFPEISAIFLQRLKKNIPFVLSKLGMGLFPISHIEVQLTAHNDNNYFRLHSDNGTPETATRELTYCYYFYREPKPFSGGELVMYDRQIINSTYYPSDSFQTIEPRNNSIVFFPSNCYHEVLPVTCVSHAFADSRFTINGWVRREESFKF